MSPPTLSPPPHLAALPLCSLVGWPVQFLGLVVTPYLALRYYVSMEADPLDDAEVGGWGWCGWTAALLLWADVGCGVCEQEVGGELLCTTLLAFFTVDDQQ